MPEVTIIKEIIRRITVLDLKIALSNPKFTMATHFNYTVNVDCDCKVVANDSGRCHRMINIVVTCKIALKYSITDVFLSG